jgi:2-C-methyl-D-erythritol 4-phosphate cytidylyltransferase
MEPQVHEGAAVAIVLAAGVGQRVGGDRPKAFLTIGGLPILSVAVGAAAASPAIGRIIVTVPAGWEDEARERLAATGEQVPIEVVTGGVSRQESVRAALSAMDGVSGADDVPVVIHDAARPFAPPDLFTAVVAALGTGTQEAADGAIPIIPIADTVKRLQDGLVTVTIPREELGLAQTPQAFRAGPLRDAHTRAAAAGLELTDDASAVEVAGGLVRAVPGDPTNVKITTFLDLAQADARMSAPIESAPSDGDG